MDTIHHFHLFQLNQTSSSLLNPITNPAPHPTIQSLLYRLQSIFDPTKCLVTQTKLCCAIETYRHPQPVLQFYLPFWQLTIHENDYLITNFVALFGLYQWIIFRQNIHPAQSVFPTDRPPTTNEFTSCHSLELIVINLVYVDALSGTANVLLM